MISMSDTEKPRSLAGAFVNGRVCFSIAIFIKDIITEVAGARGAEDGVIVSWGTAFQSHEKKGSGADGGDGCTARRMHLHY